MVWLLSLLKPVWGWFLSFGVQWIIDFGAGIYLDYKAKKERDAKLDKAKDELKSELKEAKDVKSQEDAIDKYLDSRN